MTTWALILAGGSGTRFWPASTRATPKQLLPLLPDGRCLLEATVERLAGVADRCAVITAADQVDGVRAVTDVALTVEPEPRNTAPAILLGVADCLRAGAGDEDVILILPSDAWVADEAAWRASLATALRAAAEHEAIVTLGVPPTRPATGYGYLSLGEVVEPAARDGAPCVRRLRRFEEKPDRATAEAYLRSGDAWWNAGIFGFRVGVLRRVLDAVRPDLAAGLQRLATAPGTERAAAYATLEKQSIDYAVMERAPAVLAAEAVMGWSDLGSWDALEPVLDPVEGGVGRAATVAATDARDNVVFAPGCRVALLGVEGLVVVVTDDGVLVAPKDRAQEVRDLARRLS
jgi:mannose-1-phosphate guanylyltransferase/mannose-6-phosphate isomerase